MTFQWCFDDDDDENDDDDDGANRNMDQTTSIPQLAVCIVFNQRIKAFNKSVKYSKLQKNIDTIYD